MHTSNESNKQNDRNKPVYTLGVTSRISGIQSHSIRQYVDMGLIIPYKLESRRHLFSENDIERLQLIQDLIHERGLNFSGVRSLMAMLPCWAITDCPDKDRKSCGAYNEDFTPCWEASNKGRLCKNKDCRECRVYHSLDLNSGVKSVLKDLL